MVREFEALANTIMHRWATERDLWVSPSEVREARAYLASHGVRSRERTDGTFEIGDEDAQSYDAARLVLLGLRRVHAARRPAALAR